MHDADLDLNSPADRAKLGALIMAHMSTCCPSPDYVLDINLADDSIVIKWCPP